MLKLNICMCYRNSLCNLTALLALLTTLAISSYGKAQDLTDLDLASLMQIEITSVSRKEEPARAAAAAISVITSEEIARTPATQIPELLRAVPGLQVAQIDTGQWAITVRGFNSSFANKLLVMIDGKTTYTPLFSGVFWDSKDLVLEDIDRIEIIRGPGAVMWGANAVNGVINIITKKARETKGLLISASAGNEQKGTGAIRYGDSLGEHGAIRVHAKYRSIDGGDYVDGGGDSYSDLEDLHTGFRYDYDDSEDSFTLSGELFQGTPQNAYTAFTRFPPVAKEVTEPGHYTGGSLLATWNRALGSNESLRAQLYYDSESRDDLLLDNRVDTIDAELNYQFRWGTRHAFIIGSNYRWMRDQLNGSDTITFPNNSQRVNRASLFLQDEIGVIPEKLQLTIGAKLEYHDYVGLEAEPNLRAAWQIAPQHTLWSSASYSARLPSRAENDVISIAGIEATSQNFTEFLAVGNTSTDSERVTSFELGYRGEVASWLTLDLASYYNRYRETSSITPGIPTLLGFLDDKSLVGVPLVLSNQGDAVGFGLELSVITTLEPWASVQFGGNVLNIDYDYPIGGSEGVGGGAQGSDPRHQAFLKVYVQPFEKMDLTAQIRYVDSLPAFAIDAYVEGDLRIAYRPIADLEFSLNGVNLLNPRHREYATQGLAGPNANISRSIWGAFKVRF